MSEERRDRRWWRLYVADKVCSYSDGSDNVGFIANDLVYDETLQDLFLIGEAPSKILDAVREQYPILP